MELNGRAINPKTVKVDGTPNWVGHGILDPYFASAEYMDGTPLTDDDIEELNQCYDVHEWMAEDFFI